MAAANPPTQDGYFQSATGDFTEEQRQTYRDNYYDEYETEDENEHLPANALSQQEKRGFRPGQIIRTAMVRYADPDASVKKEREREREKNMFIEKHAESECRLSVYSYTNI